MPGTSSNYGSPDGSGPDLDGIVTVHLMHSSKSSEICCYHSLVDSKISTIKSRLFVKPWVWSPPELPVLSDRQCMSLFAAMEVNVSTLAENVRSLTARICKIETNATSVSSGSHSARSCYILEHNDGSTATGSVGSHGPGSSDNKRNTRRKLDTYSSPEDEQAWSAVILLFPCEQYHIGITNWTNDHREKSIIPAYNKPVRISLQGRFPVSHTCIRNNSQVSGLCFVARF